MLKFSLIYFISFLLSTFFYDIIPLVIKNLVVCGGRFSRYFCLRKKRVKTFKMPSGYFKKFKDRQLMGRLKKRDQEAFILAYDANVKEINRFIYFKVGNREEADDLTSLIFLKAWNYVQSKNLLEAKTLRALLYKIARNAIIDHYREQGARLELSFGANLNDDNELKEGMEFIKDEKSDVKALENRIDNDAELALIQKNLPLLKEEYRELIIMRFINDLSLEEIADINQKSRGSIRVSLHRALKALRELIEEEQAGLIKEDKKENKKEDKADAVTKS